jgi:hypothetical protein
LVGKPGGKRPLGKPEYRWVDSVKIDLKGTGWEVVDWKHLAHGRHKWWAVVYTAVNLHIP